MKTQIIRLEPHDDIISASDKMGWGQTARILLVWPERGHVLTRRLDLILLQRRSSTLGAQLALVTSDARVRFHARQMGIPVFKSLRKAQSAHWRLERRLRRAQAQALKSLEKLRQDSFQPAGRTLPPPPPPAVFNLSPAARLAVFTLGVLALLSIAAVLLPKARVDLAPQVKTQEVTLEVEANPELNSVNLSGAIPARLESVIVEGRDQRPASGSIRISDQPATGQVLFTNLTEQVVRIPQGSVVRTRGENAIRFVTTSSGEVTAGPGEMLLLPVQALSPGREGNLPSERLVAIEGLLGTQVSATNPLPTRGGSNLLVLAPSEHDRQELSMHLSEALARTALKEIRNRLAPGDLLLSSEPVLTRTLEESYDPRDAQPADQLSLSLRLEFKALKATREDMLALAAAVLDASLPPGFSLLPDSLEIETLTVPEIDGGSRAHWRIIARRKLQAQLSQPQAIQLALGGSPEQAQERLAAALPLEGFPQIRLTPGWWPRMPLVPFRIEVESETWYEGSSSVMR